MTAALAPGPPILTIATRLRSIWLVELASLADPNLVPLAVAESIGLPTDGGAKSAEGMARDIGGKRLLLVLDNCEHLIDAAAQLAESILRLASRTVILATSRETLRTNDEHVYRVPPLDVPHHDCPCRCVGTVPGGRRPGGPFCAAEDRASYGAAAPSDTACGFRLELCAAAARRVSAASPPGHLLRRIFVRRRLRGDAWSVAGRGRGRYRRPRRKVGRQS